MPGLDVAVIALAAGTGALAVGDGRSPAERRLAALSAPALRRPPRLLPRLPRMLAAAAVLAACWALGGAGLGLFGGALLAGFVVWRRKRAAASPPSAGRDTEITAVLPLALDLLAAGLRAGAHPTDMVAAVAQALGGPLGTALDGVARQLRLGADPARAWQSLHAPAELAAVGRALARASHTGAPLADVVESHAADCRRTARATALELAHRTGVAVVIPLGVCFLPAFVLLGVVPLAAGLVSGLVLP